MDRLITELADKGIHPPENKGINVSSGEGTVTSDVKSDISDAISDPDTLLRERGLKPEEWEITHLKVNEWDGPFGEPCKQLTVNVKRRQQIQLFQPAFVPDSYVAPKKRASAKGDSKLVVFVGDQQAPHHDVDLHELFLEWLKKNQPQEGVLIGDTVDLPDVSRHNPNPEWDMCVQDCINAGYLLLRDYVQANTQTKWTKLMGNHDERIRNRLLAQVQNLYDLRVAFDEAEEPEPPVWCMSNLLRLKALGIDFVTPNGGYAHAQTKVSKHLAARHGWIAKKGSGASALATLEQLGYSIVVGHTHRQSLVYKTTHDIDGAISTLAAAETGCMCYIKDGLGYTVAPDWQNGFCTAQVWPDGTFKLDLATYTNGTLYWRDQRFD